MNSTRTNKLTCIVTGRKLVATKDYYKRKLDKAGSEEHLHSTYICREAKNLIKKGTTVERVREILGVESDNLPEVDQQIIDDVIAETKSTRLRRINNIMNTSSMINMATDPEVKQFINNIKNAK